jgi:predicted DNA binding CopG/RHH family protein
LEQVIGEKGRKSMNKKKIKYTDEAIGNIRIIQDFLPPPAMLIQKTETVKVTLALSKSSLDFFKHQAQSKHTPYQKMIRSLLDQYAAHFAEI